MNLRQIRAGVHILHQTAADLDSHSGGRKNDALLVIHAVVLLDRNRSFFRAAAVFPVDAVWCVAFDVLGYVQIAHLLVREMKKGTLSSVPNFAPKGPYI